MKKLPISTFDLGIIIAFVVIGLLGGGAWYYFSGQLQDAQQSVTTAKSQFDTYSSYKGSSQTILVTRGNQKNLQTNIDLLKAQLTPLIQDKLMPKENKLYSIEKLDPVAWKHSLDDKVRELTAGAGSHGVKLPPNFYFTFANYLNQNPADSQTEVLSKQMVAVDEISKILINAPVQNILDIGRTFEEDAKQGGGSLPPPSGGAAATPGRVNGSSYLSEGGAYRVYPFVFECETSTTGFRKVMNALVQSPYIFIVRTVTVQNMQPASPHPADLDKIAGNNDISVTGSDPGKVASTVSTKGPQYLFGNVPLHVRVRVDMIEWLTPAPVKPDNTTGAN